MPLTRVLILANSRKLSGRCVAGRVLADDGNGNWIRPVGASPHGELRGGEGRCLDGSEPQLLDVVDIPLTTHVPHACQTENWRFDAAVRWQKVEHLGWTELMRYVEHPEQIWINGFSTRQGENDEIPLELANRLPNSLVLVHLPRLDILVFAPGANFGEARRRVQATFEYRGARYALWVTDPAVERHYLAQPDGRYVVGECCVCISLSEPHNKDNGDSYRYKLVASVITRDDFGP